MKIRNVEKWNKKIQLMFISFQVFFYDFSFILHFR